ncbi:PREDICTED: uncharacterized protein LOC108560342 [Nicrophorus vespilloides]|uniref:Uncharacterized protein LOC108560342 n=1 Tax=Nicrophorus vespilloides TaxID=110193 RepID=A0ABM1MFJ0_NICVS|nr:PREDICTED: uncharacterized protein LOC108560342 [Nicrophorus vespilloides]
MPGETVETIGELHLLVERSAANVMHDDKVEVVEAETKNIGNDDNNDETVKEVDDHDDDDDDDGEMMDEERQLAPSGLSKKRFSIEQDFLEKTANTLRWHLVFSVFLTWFVGLVVVCVSSVAMYHSKAVWDFWGEQNLDEINSFLAMVQNVSNLEQLSEVLFKQQIFGTIFVTFGGFNAQLTCAITIFVYGAYLVRNPQDIYVWFLYGVNNMIYMLFYGIFFDRCMRAPITDPLERCNARILQRIDTFELSTLCKWLQTMTVILAVFNAIVVKYCKMVHVKAHKLVKEEKMYYDYVDVSEEDLVGDPKPVGLSLLPQKEDDDPPVIVH